MTWYKVTITFKDYKELELLCEKVELDAKTNRLICHLLDYKVHKYYILLDGVILYHIEEIK